jgi:hypothetical protein
VVHAKNKNVVRLQLCNVIKVAKKERSHAIRKKIFVAQGKRQVNLVMQIAPWVNLNMEDIMDMLKADRTAFEAILSDGEKAVIASAKADFSTIDHDSLMNLSKEEMMKQHEATFAKIAPVVEAHKEALESFIEKNKGGMKHHEMKMDMSEVHHFEMLCIHFLLM